MQQTITDLLRKYDDVLVIIGALAVSFQAIVASLVTVAGLLGKLALYTATKSDDELFASISLRLGQLHDAVQRFAAWVPRARFGKAKEPLIGTSIAPPAPRPATPPPAMPEPGVVAVLSTTVSNRARPRPQRPIAPPALGDPASARQVQPRPRRVTDTTDS